MIFDIKIGKEIWPITFTKRVAGLWEKETGKHRKFLLDENLTKDEDFIYLICAFKEGFRKKGKKWKDITLEDMYDMDEDHDIEGQIQNLRKEEVKN